ncbi:MAG TPA: glycosyltransferase family 2 protein [Candidatus Eisenbacteria bacterium]|nr:glycosyltransferase family 2 protein [Candidatus Eisenbacteria bacterium]
MRTLSVVVSVFNGERYLLDCLNSIKTIADEIIVVDHESSDASSAIAKKFTKKVYIQKNDTSKIDIQKNFGFEKATKDWILSLDADESVSPQLALEIKEKIENSDVVGYAIPRKNIIFGKWIEHTGWYPDFQVRLFVRGKGKFTKKHVHESIEISGTVEKLNNPFIHEAYQSIYQFLHRGFTLYAPNEAESLRDNGYVFSYEDAIRFPFQEFLGRFFAREGYRDGFHGLILSLLMAMYHFAVFLYLWEYEKFPASTHVTTLLSHELHTAHAEWTYWTTSMSINQSKNSAKKVLLKAKRKLGL